MSNEREPMTLVLTGFQVERVEQMLVDRLTEAAHERLSKSIEEHVDAIVTQEMAHYSREIVRERIEQAIAEGWTSTNHYGEPTGTKKGLKERIGELLTKVDGYGDRETFAQKATREAVSAALSKEFAAEIASLKTKFAAEVDAALKGKLAETLRRSLGL